jgi:hypothetical protein
VSTLKTSNIQDTSGSNNSTPEEINQGRAKAWVNFNGAGTLAIRDSFNVGSVTDVATGKYTINFTNSFATTNYCPVMYNNANSLVGLVNFSNQYLGGMKLNTSSLEVASYNAGYSDSANFFVVVFGD